MPPLLLTAVAIMLLAAAVQAVTGFGFALVSVPLLALATDPRTAVVTAALAALVMTVAVAVRERRYVQWRTAGVLVAASLLGMPAGLLLLRLAPDRLLTGLIGAAVMGCAVLIWRGFAIPHRRSVVIGIGVLAGALSTSTGTNGPPLVAAFQAMGYEPRRFRATLAGVFTGAALLSVTGFAVTGQLAPMALQLGLAGVPAVLVGWWCGNRLFHRIDPLRFRRVVIGSLMAGGLLIVVPVVGG